MTPAQNSATERKGPDPAASPTSAGSTASVGQRTSNDERSQKHECSATASPRNQTFLELAGASSLQKSEKYERQHAANCGSPPQNQPQLDTPPSLPSVISLTTSSEHAQDERSKLSLDSVVRPGFCSPLMLLASPADYLQAENTPTPSKTLGTSSFEEEKNEAKVVGPIIMVAVMVGVIGAAIFTLVVRGHHALRNSSLRSTGASITTLPPVKRNAASFVLRASTGEDRQAAGGKDST